MHTESVLAANEWLKPGTTVSCGNIKNIPSKVPELSSSLLSAVQVIVPIILVIMGTIDLVKGIMSQKEDEMKKGRTALVKRITMGLVVFLIIALVKLLVNVVVANDTVRGSIVSCIDCFINNSCN